MCLGVVTALVILVLWVVRKAVVACLERRLLRIHRNPSVASNPQHLSNLSTVEL